MIRLIVLVVVLLYVNCDSSSSLHEDEIMIPLYDEAYNGSVSSSRRLEESIKVIDGVRYVVRKVPRGHGHKGRHFPAASSIASSFDTGSSGSSSPPPPPPPAKKVVKYLFDHSQLGTSNYNKVNIIIIIVHYHHHYHLLIRNLKL